MLFFTNPFIIPSQYVFFEESLFFGKCLVLWPGFYWNLCSYTVFINSSLRKCYRYTTTKITFKEQQSCRFPLPQSTRGNTPSLSTSTQLTAEPTSQYLTILYNCLALTPFTWSAVNCLLFLIILLSIMLHYQCIQYIFNILPLNR